MSQEFTDELLSLFDGTNDTHIFVGVNGKVYDVTSNKDAYKPPNGEYSVMAGKDVTRGLAKHSLNAEDFKPYGSLEGLSEEELKIVQQWEEFFKNKYQIVGHIKKDE